MSERAEAGGATLRVTEIFHSIQGESTHTGRPCVFVRLTGCPLRCVWCDTAYAFQGGEVCSLEDVLRRVAAFECPLVEVTGGEPMAQPATAVLLTRLADRGYEVLLETSGAFAIDGLDPRVSVILDVKCPDSGESERNLWANLGVLKPRDEVKFVVASRRDYEWAREIIARERLASRNTVLLSPVTSSLEPGDLAAWVLADRLPVRVQVQLHKILFGDRPGV